MTEDDTKHPKYKIVFEKLADAQASEFGRAAEGMEDEIRQIKRLSDLLANPDANDDRQFTST